MVQNDNKICPSRSISQEPYIIWLSFVVHMCKMIISLGVFFIFSKYLFFVLLGGLKGKKWSKMTKKICLSGSISQEPYIIWLSFMVQMCKMIKSPGVFFKFKILIFWVARELKGEKVAQNEKNFCLVYLIFQEPYIIWSSSMIHMYVCMYKRIIFPRIFFIFSQNFDFRDH